MNDEARQARRPLTRSRWFWLLVALMALVSVAVPTTVYVREHVLIPMRLAERGWELNGHDSPPRLIARTGIPNTRFLFNEVHSARINPRGAVTEDDFRRIAAMPELEWLQVHNQRFDGDWLGHMEGHPRLRLLDLWGDAFDDEDLVTIATVTGLQSLEVGGGEITDDSLAHLSPLTHLARLTLTDCQVTGTGVRHLTSLKGLVVLQFGHCPITEQGMQVITDFPLTHLAVSESPVDDAMARHLEKLHSSLTSLIIGRTNITDESAETLASLTGLEELWLYDTAIGDQTLERLGTLTKLRTLSLSGTNVTNEGMRHLMALPSLEKLVLVDTAVTSEAFTYLAGVPPLAKLFIDARNVRQEDLDRFHAASPGVRVKLY